MRELPMPALCPKTTHTGVREIPLPSGCRRIMPEDVLQRGTTSLTGFSRGHSIPPNPAESRGSARAHHGPDAAAPNCLAPSTEPLRAAAGASSSSSPEPLVAWRSRGSRPRIPRPPPRGRRAGARRRRPPLPPSRGFAPALWPLIRPGSARLRHRCRGGGVIVVVELPPSLPCSSVETSTVHAHRPPWPLLPRTDAAMGKLRPDTAWTDAGMRSVGAATLASSAAKAREGPPDPSPRRPEGGRSRGGRPYPACPAPPTCRLAPTAAPPCSHRRPTPPPSSKSVDPPWIHLLTQNVHLAPSTQQAEQAGFTRAKSHETCQSIFPEN
jgi:hypothetical protein